jgi:hypothetical protein
MNMNQRDKYEHTPWFIHWKTLDLYKKPPASLNKILRQRATPSPY